MIVILKDFPIGSVVPSVKDEDRLALDELHRAFAPEQEVPDAIHAALARAETPTSSAEVPGEAIDGAFEGTGAPTAGESPEVGQTSQALESRIPIDEWRTRYCGFSGVDFRWCVPVAPQGVTARKLSHRTAAAMCGDTGPVALRFKKSGDTLLLGDIPWGACATMSQYHGPHDFLGQNLQRTLEVSVDWAWESARFSGYFVDNDRFISGPF
jgi:hypothetical protein